MFRSVARAEPHRVRQLREVVGHQGDVGRLERDVAAGGAHGDADVGGGERRGVVDAVADHRDRAVPLAQLRERVSLVAGQELGVGFVESRASQHRLRARPGIAREQHDAMHTLIAKAGDRFPAGFARAIGEPDDAERGSRMTHEHRRGAAFLHFFDRAWSDGVQSRRSSNSRWLPIECRRRGDHGFGAEARQRLNASPGANTRPASRARSTIARPIGCSDRDSSAAATASTPLVETPSTPSTSVTVTWSCVKRAGLVERQAPHGREPFEMRAAFDQHALPRRRR